MFRPRIIPVLLLKGDGLVKTRQFQKDNARYIGDPINAVKIFNDLETDELVFLDILASLRDHCISLDLVKKIGDEAFMPFAVGGGIKTLDDIYQLLHAGAEKVILNTAAFQTPRLIREAADRFGSQSIVVSIDTRKRLTGREEVMVLGGTVKTGLSPDEAALRMMNLGAGELMIHSIDRDGQMRGYDTALLRRISNKVTVPVVACGGAGNPGHMREAVREGGAHAVAAGSVFVFHGPRKAVLINYPEKNELNSLFSET